MKQPSSPGADLIGKRVVVGMNLARSDGSLIEKRQFHGVITEADDEGVVVREPNGDQRVLPPAWRAYTPARPGNYRLRATGESVKNPDLESVWTIWAAGTPEEWWEAVTGRSPPDAAEAE